MEKIKKRALAENRTDEMQRRKNERIARKKRGDSGTNLGWSERCREAARVMGVDPKNA